MNRPPPIENWHTGTLLVHGGAQRNEASGTLPSITLSAAFEHASAEDMQDVFSHQREGHAYSRLSNPTVAALEARITAISAARGTIAVASGMSAVALALLALVRAGDHVVAGKHVFGGTYTLLDQTLARLGVNTTWVDVRSQSAIVQALRPETRAVLVEAIANPAMVVPDFAGLRAHCTARQIPLLVDATLVTPLQFDAAATGAAVAIYSSSKFIAGAATTIGGLIVDTGRFSWSTAPNVDLGEFKRTGDAAFLNRIRRELMAGVGPAISPHTAYLQLLGIETLALGTERQARSTLQIAQWLERQPAVSAVFYPGLESHPDHASCGRSFRGGFGSVLSFTLASKSACFRFLNSLRLFMRASNLGDTRSLALHPASTIYQAFWPAQRDELGVPESLIRLSVGIEDAEDLLADLSTALSTAG